MAISGKTKLKIVFSAVAVVLAIVLIYIGLRDLETRNQPEEARGSLSQLSDEITVDGISYKARKNLTTVLIMGIDKRDEDDLGYTSYRAGGQADFLRLLVVDSTSDTVIQIPIDRDTMTDIETLSITGKAAGSKVAQICLSHAFGDGKAQSCELTREAVSNLLQGIGIDYYVAVNMDGICALNDWAGGVTVTLEDDFSDIDPDMIAGKTIRLQGEQAEIFVRSRMEVSDGTNVSRMRRQETFITGLIDLLREKFSADKNSIGEVYDMLGDHMVTDLSRGKMVNGVWQVKDMATGTVSIDGEHKIGSTGFMEFYADVQSIENAVLTVFYKKDD